VTTDLQRAYGKRSEQRTLEAAQVLLTVLRPVDNQMSTAEALLSISPSVSPMEIVSMPSSFNLLMGSAGLDRLAEKAMHIRQAATFQTTILQRPKQTARPKREDQCKKVVTDRFSPNYAEICNTDGRVGVYLPAERKIMLKRFHAKRQQRVWRKKIRYGCRKNLADNRIRVKGRFVKREKMKAGEAATAAVAAAAAAEFAVAKLACLGIEC
jgi:hypothetical protein